MNSLFRVSARNHAGLILMADLASSKSQARSSKPGERHAGLRTPDSGLGLFVSLKDVAERMGLSQGFLEEIAMDLKKAGLIQGRKGPRGGYRLSQDANKISAEAILNALEGPVNMIGCTCGPCPKEKNCTSKNLWSFLQRDVIKSLKKTTLADIVK